MEIIIAVMIVRFLHDVLKRYLEYSEKPKNDAKRKNDESFTWHDEVIEIVDAPEEGQGHERA